MSLCLLITGVSVITRIAPGGSDGELSDRDIFFNGAGKTS